MAFQQEVAHEVNAAANLFDSDEEDFSGPGIAPTASSQVAPGGRRMSLGAAPAGRRMSLGAAPVERRMSVGAAPGGRRMSAAQVMSMAVGDGEEDFISGEDIRDKEFEVGSLAADLSEKLAIGREKGRKKGPCGQKFAPAPSSERRRSVS